MQSSEFDLSGLAVVTKLVQRDDIDDDELSEGNLVTGRFKTLGALNLVRATFSDGTEITGTDTHRFWSLDREEWIPLGVLEQYECVQTVEGSIYLLSVVPAEPELIYNLEVDCKHVYQVGNAGVLVHNDCLRLQYLGRTPGKTSRTGKDVIERLRSEGKVIGYGSKAKFLNEADGQWYKLKYADMSHIRDAVWYWNRYGRHTGARSAQVRAWMLNPNNYTLEHFKNNRSAGAMLSHIRNYLDATV